MINLFLILPVAEDGPGFAHGQGEEIFFIQKGPDRLWDPPSLPFNDYRCSFMTVKLPGCDFYHLHPSSVDITNEWVCTSTPAYLYGVGGENNFVFTCP